MLSSGILFNLRKTDIILTVFERRHNNLPQKEKDLAAENASYLFLWKDNGLEGGILKLQGLDLYKFPNLENTGYHFSAHNPSRHMKRIRFEQRKRFPFVED